MATVPSPPYRGIEWNDSLEKTALARAAIARGHLRVERWLLQRATTTPLTLKLVEDFHRVMFCDVFPDFAGHIRGPVPPQIPQNVTFGSFRATPYDKVPGECAKLFADVGMLIRQLDERRTARSRPEFDEDTLKAAAYSHCELIRIHPFRNGNGRIARLCINYFASRYGMLPVPIERPQGDYLNATVCWLRTKSINAFEDFLHPSWLRNSQ